MQIKRPTKSKKAEDRRRYLRLTKNLAIKIEDKDVDLVTETKNISCIGAYCQVDAYLPVLTKLSITLLIPKTKSTKAAKHITCEGTVVRVEKCNAPLEHSAYNIAVYFNRISKADMKFIDAYVKNNLAASS